MNRYLFALIIAFDVFILPWPSKKVVMEEPIEPIEEVKESNTESIWSYNTNYKLKKDFALEFIDD